MPGDVTLHCEPVVRLGGVLSAEKSDITLLDDHCPRRERPALPVVRTEETRVISADDETTVEATFPATHDGEFDGIPRTGEPIAVPFVSIVMVSDDGITCWRDYWDQQTVAEQLGLE